jgi:hypothetical protein
MVQIMHIEVFIGQGTELNPVEDVRMYSQFLFKDLEISLFSCVFE